MKTNMRRLSHCASACLAVITAALPCDGATIIYDTAPYRSESAFGGVGPGQSSTIAQTFVAPTGAGVTLNDFNFYAESYYPLNGGVATLHLRAFVYEWAGNLTGRGGGAVGSPLYLSPSFGFSPPPHPGGWVPLTATIGGGGLMLTAGQHYVMGFTLSDPADFAASHGAIEFQVVSARNPYDLPPPIPFGVDFGSGGAVWLNNRDNFAALNTTIWDTWGDIGTFAFTARFTVVPEPAAAALTLLGVSLCISHRIKRCQITRGLTRATPQSANNLCRLVGQLEH